MPWNSVRDPTLLQGGAITFIKKVWRFEKNPIVVVLFPDGDVMNTNAFPMMCIWGSLAFLFTMRKEEALWNEEMWSLAMLVYEIDPLIQSWMVEEKIVCLYGGEDIQWIRKLTTIVRNAAQVTGVSVEMVYVGKSNPNENVQMIVDTIATDKLSHYLENLGSMWFFWNRLEMMWYSKVQNCKAKENDPIVQELQMISTLDKSNKGWAMIGKDMGATTTVKGEILFTSLSQIHAWKGDVVSKGFVKALNEQLHQHRCKEIILPGIHTEIMMCEECGRPMEKYYMYEY